MSSHNLGFILRNHEQQAIQLGHSAVVGESSVNVMTNDANGRNSQILISDNTSLGLNGECDPKLGC
jgi:hypothetical protein